jgi:hypothetical protein
MMKNKGVSFNVGNDEDKELLDFAERTYSNFSGQMKEWIRKDKQNRENATLRRNEGGGIRINVG